METKNNNSDANLGKKIFFTPQQAKDIEAFRALLKKGSIQEKIGFEETFDQAIESLKSHSFVESKVEINGELVKKELIPLARDEVTISFLNSCLNCDADIKIPQDVVQGELATCKECGESFEVVRNENGIKLKAAEKVGEDWGE